MSTPLLATKLYLPPARPNVIMRARLIARLDAGLHRKLTLISAPAGFGKTTLISAWIAGAARPTAWLALEAGESDPARFLRYLVAALQTFAPELGASVIAALDAPQPPPAEALLTALLNDLSALKDKRILVLDDYHLVDSRAVDTALAFLLEHLPPQLHLVITTREDPQLPLARLRARGQVTELRAADLRFTASEAAEFLAEVMGLRLTAADVAALDDRTEGWIAGLQLAALSLEQHPDAAGFIRAFAGDHRYIVDYLVEEVLQRQPAPVRSFLLQTSILDRLYGPLCDAVTGQADGSARLEALERGNFFVVPLDDTRHWYRYHHLFADVLAAQLQVEQPELVGTLHRRASAWYEQHGAAADAIRHALAAEDLARAASLIELAVPDMSRNRQTATMLGWLKALPDELLKRRPVLSAAYGGVLLSSGELAGVEARLRDAEQWLEPPADTRAGPDASAAMVVVDDAAFRLLPGAIAVWRAGLALVQGDVAGTRTYARRALELVPEDDHIERGAAVALLGIALWASGDLEEAHQAFADGMARVQRAGYISDVLSGTIALADIRVAQGRLREALRTYEQALQLAAQQGDPVLRGTADIYVGLSELHREQNDLSAAVRELLRSKAQAERSGFPHNRYRWCVAMARIRDAEGDRAAALDLLDEAERLYVSDFFPTVRPVAALKARLWIAGGRLDAAAGWAGAQGLSAADELSYLREFEHITLARLLLARVTTNRADSAGLEVAGLLQRLLRAAEAGGRTGSVIEILVLQALFQQRQGDITAALGPLERALSLAEPEGYVRVFADEGRPMTHLLQEAAARGILPAYTGTLLAACPAGAPRSAGAAASRTASAPQPLAEPLSQRELEVLRLFRTELSGPEIARELVIAVSTVRTHTKQIYSKLNVNTRRAAVKRATELDLL